MPHDQAYLQAEKKIEEALQSGAMELDLRDMHLTELPESIGQLTQLQSLDLSSNNLTTLPKWLGQLTQLQELHLFHDQLKILPETLGQLTHLRLLELSIMSKENRPGRFYEPGMERPERRMVRLTNISLGS